MNYNVRTNNEWDSCVPMNQSESDPLGACSKLAVSCSSVHVDCGIGNARRELERKHLLDKGGEVILRMLTVHDGLVPRRCSPSPSTRSGVLSLGLLASGAGSFL